MNDTVISEYNHNNISFQIIILLSVLSAVIGAIVLRLMMMSINFLEELKMLIEEVKNEELLYNKVKIYLHKIKGRIFCVFMFEFIIMIALNYYITVFCVVFHSNQINVLVNTLFSIIISILFSFFIF